MKYAGSLKAVFMDLRQDPRPGVTNLWKDHHYTVLAVDPESNQVHLDQHAQNNFDSIWVHHGQQLHVAEHQDDLCTVFSQDPLVPGAQVTQRTFVTRTNDILNAFEQHWKPRWNTISQVSDQAWQRIPYPGLHAALHATAAL